MVIAEKSHFIGIHLWNEIFQLLGHRCRYEYFEICQKYLCSIEQCIFHIVDFLLWTEKKSFSRSSNVYGKLRWTCSQHSAFGDLKTSGVIILPWRSRTMLCSRKSLGRRIESIVGWRWCSNATNDCRLVRNDPKSWAKTISKCFKDQTWFYDENNGSWMNTTERQRKNEKSTSEMLLSRVERNFFWATNHNEWLSMGVFLQSQSLIYKPKTN